MKLKISSVVGYAMAFLGVVSSFWGMILERQVLSIKPGSIVWIAAMFMGLVLVQSSEVARVKKILGESYPKNAELRKFIGLSAVIAAAALLFMLK